MPARKTSARSNEKPAPAAKSTSRSTSAKPKVSRAEALGLVAEPGQPGVFRSKTGTLCDENGVMLGWAELKRKEDATHMEVLGHPVTSPAQYLKSVALDPRLPLPVRIDAAKAAAPYTDRKQPQAIDGGLDPATGAPVNLFPKSFYEGLSPEQITLMKAILEEKEKEAS